MTAPDEGVAWLNRLPRERAAQRLAACCASSRWAARMADARPFSDRAHLLQAADRIWAALGPEDWVEAFRGHPEIGARSPEHAAPQSAAWSADEQGGVRNAARDVTDRLAEGNRTYRERFGYIFIVCATGRSAAEMLEILDARLRNSPDVELEVATEEQRKITALRLEKLLNTPPETAETTS